MQLRWQAHANGIEVKTLVDRGLGSLLLQALRFAPSARMSRPLMLAGLVLDGEAIVDGERLGSWDFLYATPGTEQAPVSFPKGATLLAVSLR